MGKFIYPQKLGSIIVYGNLKPDSLAYHLIDEYVSSVQPIELPWEINVFDGAPFIDFNNRNDRAKGYLISFSSKDGMKKAYDKICAYESLRDDRSSLYKWGKCEIKIENMGNIIDANILIWNNINSLRRDSWQKTDGEWMWQCDILFDEGISWLDSKLYDDKRVPSFSKVIGSEDHSTLFELQLLYMFLWMVIDRYTRLKYGENSKRLSLAIDIRKNDVKANDLLKKLNPGVAEKIISSDRAKGLCYCQNMHEYGSPQHYNDAINYFYQIRSNIVHNGKGIMEDYKTIHNALYTLMPRFKRCLEAEKTVCEEKLKELKEGNKWHRDSLITEFIAVDTTSTMCPILKLSGTYLQNTP